MSAKDSGEEGRKQLKSLIEDDELELQHIRPVGDVLHIFSHIRKTYRAQWIKVVGGSQPPKFRQTKAKGLQIELMWRPLMEVESAKWV